MLYTVWVGGTQVNDYYFDNILSAKKLAYEYVDQGYIDVFIESFKNSNIEERSWRNYKLN